MAMSVRYGCVAGLGCLSSCLALGLAAGGGALAAEAPANPPQATLDHTQLLAVLGPDGRIQPVQTPADWASRRQQIVAGMELVMGKLPERSGLPPPQVEVLGQTDKDGYTQVSLRYRSDEDDWVPAYLLLPAGRPAGRRGPAMLALHQTTGAGKKEVAGEEGSGNLAYGMELAQRGYVVLAPDAPPFGDYAFDFAKSKYVSGTMKSIYNHMRGVDLLLTRPEVDPERLGVIGHSLGGHNALFVGVFDTRLKAIISSSGWTPFHDDDVPSWTAPSYMPRIATVYGNDADRLPFDFYEVVAALAPRAFFSNSPRQDSDFDFHGVQKAEPKIREVFALLGAADRLQIRYPDSPHDFPPAVRREAYEFLDRLFHHDPARRVP
jgi:dienelactone hydrolase